MTKKCLIVFADAEQKDGHRDQDGEQRVGTVLQVVHGVGKLLPGKTLHDLNVYATKDQTAKQTQDDPKHQEGKAVHGAVDP